MKWLANFVASMDDWWLMTSMDHFQLHNLSYLWDNVAWRILNFDWSGGFCTIIQESDFSQTCSFYKNWAL